MMIKNVLVTGVAGFIGFHLSLKLLREGISVTGIDNINSYYDPSLKKLRLKILNEFAKNNNGNFTFKKVDISSTKKIELLFENNCFDYVIHLAAQAGVRTSLTKPFDYNKSNITGFLNILEGCRKNKPKHLLFASSSSVYGMNSSIPFTTNDNTDFPVSLYAASKKSNELMAHTYSHLYDISITGLRFFTVYGPFGRPDMAYFKFTKAILNEQPIDIYNHGKMKRDFTYVDDIVESIYRLIPISPKLNTSKHSYAQAKFKIYNIGNNNPVTLKRFISAIEKATNKTAIKNNLPMQAGDVPITYANIDELIETIKFKPTTSIEEGIKKFVQWYYDYQ
ncbi:NAD-dependent epimerase/dehydratase family protein [Gammaproteobacteria bacterium]|nr:NAD-dependent epimerase/dehydratase family protein [Gammaproteobacteria bacterium]